jgi:hypothetical protein
MGAAKYMIVHELLHFPVANHGKPGKSLMRVPLRDGARYLDA